MPDDVAARWASTDAVGSLRSWVDGPSGGAADHPHADHTGHRLVEVQHGSVRGRRLPGPQPANLSGVVHGGASRGSRGQVLHTGSQRIVSEARVLRPDGALVATARGSFVPNARFVEEVAAGLRRARS